MYGVFENLETAGVSNVIQEICKWEARTLAKQLWRVLVSFYKQEGVIKGVAVYSCVCLLYTKVLYNIVTIKKIASIVLR